MRPRYGETRAIFAAAAQRASLLDAGGPAGIFLWLRVPDRDDLRMHELLLERSLLTVSGSYLGRGERDTCAPP